MTHQEPVALAHELDALTEAPAPRKGPPCTVGSILSAADDTTEAKLRWILDTRTVSATAIADVLSQHGTPVTSYTVARHRRRGQTNGCRCTPSSHPPHPEKDFSTVGLYREDGTRITRQAFPAVALDDDPPVRVTEDIYRSEPYGRGDGQPEGSKRSLLYQAGTVVPRSAIDRAFTAATVTSIAPAKGPVAGGTTITVTGAHLDGVSAVALGGSSATGLRIHSANRLTVTTPAGAAGAVTLELVDDSGTVTANGFTYGS
ncbi:IPT/TIG domain-containing protein [Streptomyces tsukubensis]